MSNMRTATAIKHDETIQMKLKKNNFIQTGCNTIEIYLDWYEMYLLKVLNIIPSLLHNIDRSALLPYKPNL